MKYQTGAWNYYAIGEYDAETMTNDFNDLGFNLVMSCDYNPYSPYFHDKAAFISHLDSLHAKGMSVVVCDVRTGWGRLKEQGEQEFVRGVKEAVSDFGSHPAVYGFFIGDEPSGAQMSDMVRAYKIVKAAAPALRPFVNFLPIWCTDDYFEKCLGVPATKYGELLDKVVKEAEIDVLCYDYYSQCSYFEADRGEAMYFMNLNVFREVAKKNDIPFFTTLLSVGHWNYRIPTEDDIRWQISTALASGVVGIMWFYIYARKLEGSFRNQPVDLFKKRTPIFDILARQNRILTECLAPELEDYEFVDNYCVGKPYHDFKEWKSGELGIDEITITEGADAPLLLARFKGENGERFAVVNCHRTLPVKVKAVRGETVSHTWYAPGQIVFFE